MKSTQSNVIYIELLEFLLQELRLEPDEEQRARRLLEQARELALLDETGARRARHARWTAGTLLGCMLLAMAVLARGTGRRAQIADWPAGGWLAKTQGRPSTRQR